MRNICVYLRDDSGWIEGDSCLPYQNSLLVPTHVMYTYLPQQVFNNKFFNKFLLTPGPLWASELKRNMKQHIYKHIDGMYESVPQKLQEIGHPKQLLQSYYWHLDIYKTITREQKHLKIQKE